MSKEQAIDKSVFRHEYYKFIENIQDYFGDNYTREHIRYLAELLCEEGERLKAELEEDD